ncbi:MAG: hypothetical protein HKN30_08385 [Sulfitobacter sp.]|nr:hypothetical protein [Sulfitobacter sp.]
MTEANPVIRPVGAALPKIWGRRLMDVILHVGAHRTATTSFQYYLRGQGDWLGAQKTGFWGPGRTRKVVFPGLFRTAAVNRWRQVARRAEGRVRMHCAQAEERGLHRLIVTDENMIGTCAQNLRTARLYPATGERMARLNAAFDGRIKRIVLTVRAQDLWWASAAALTASRGHRLPDGLKCAAIADSPRGWRDVVTDLACAVPEAEILVRPFEVAPGRVEQLLATLLGSSVPMPADAPWHNRSPDLADLRRLRSDMGADTKEPGEGLGRFQPFTPVQCAALRKHYADDLHWLAAGADGLARLTEEQAQPRAGQSLPTGQMTKGHDYDIGQGHLAQHR